MGPSNTIRVWDRFVRFFHWSLVACMVTAYLSTEHIGWTHKIAGWCALALVALRIVWGFIAPSPFARFAQFVPGPRKLLRYLGALARGREPRHLGHNPAGAVMVVYLIGAVIGIGVTGWMLTMDAFWGDELTETIHTVLVDISIWAVLLHVVANVVASVRHRENLVRSMVTGTKPTSPGSPGR